MRRLSLIPLLLFAVQACAQVSGPMQAAKRPLSPGTIHVDVNLVLIDVGVTDKYGNPVSNLQKKDFHLYEDNEEQEILTFSREDVPATVGLLIDTSQSMASRMKAAQEAATQFLKKSNPEDEFFVISFSNHAQFESSFSSDINLLQQRIAPLTAYGKTALLDAIYLGLSQMQAAHNDRHVLLIFSDGGDNHSRHHEGQIRGLLQEADSQVFALGIFNDLNAVKTDEERKGPGLLNELAEATGGSMYTVPGDASGLSEFAGKISEQLRSEYVLGFKPLVHGNDWRHLRVTVSSDQQVKVHARNGYFGPH